MFRIAVCEDDPLQMKLIMALLEIYSEKRPGMTVQAQQFDSGSAMLQTIARGATLELFLLDILLPEMNGIELAKKIREQLPEVPLVFLTSSADYALDAFQVSASQYILKPVKEKDLFPVLDGVAAARKQDRDGFFMLSTQKNTVKVPYRSIVSIELVGRAMRIHLENGETLLSKTIRTSLSEATAPLLADGRFLCEHKSFVLNMAHVQEVCATSFKMKGGLEVPVPRYNAARAKAKYFAWVREYKDAALTR